MKEINQLYPASTWHYCPTSDNPADLLTRGITADQLGLSTIWQHGPPWLTSESQWPNWSPAESQISSAQALATATATACATEDVSNQMNDQPGIHRLIDALSGPPEDVENLFCNV